jgi:flavorubredoxin
MEHFTKTMEHISPKNHYLGLFGSYSWTGGGVKTLNNFAENIDWEMVADPVDVKGVPDEEAFKGCETLANAMADKLLQE